MTLKGGASQACAACKYQRRKCKPDCPLAPFFPADQPEIFRNVHKLFGVSNVLKILKGLHPSQKHIAMRSIIDQANMRDWYPVHGCYGLIQSLHYQIQQAKEELHAIYEQLEMYRQQNQISPVPEDVPSQLELGMAPPNGALPLFHHPQQQYSAVAALPAPQNHCGDNGGVAGYDNSSDMVPKDNVENALWMQNQYANYDNSNTIQMAASQPMGVQQEIVQDYNELQPFFDTIDDAQSYMDSKEACDSSSESSLKDTRQSIEHAGKNELKSAAACFSLTSVN
ncbi:LOB domain-containing protein 27 [Syzygium oleosum]|uniref:LOB domain-containing protein 27 n=1 Tax=Syzygium oleosum TaxID=219896 RepID=UPI0011D1C225|nr:LOB domain-containing protein 27 [Syzygium oleosum]